MTGAEKAQVLLLFSQGWSITSIASTLNRCRRVVLEVITRDTVRFGGWRRGGKRKVWLRTVRLILRQAKTGNYTTRQLRDRYAPMITVRRVQQMLASDPNLSWQRATPAPSLVLITKMLV